ncbi:WWP2 ligase, partial [Polyodon spathula]|nr:WWP2 ligase [Polyodon spathula]
LSVLSAKPQSPKAPSRNSRINSFVAVTPDGLSSETKKTGRRSGNPELQWNENLTLNVTPQSRLDLKLWSCHTLRNELLGSASIDVYDTLKSNNGKIENIQLNLNLQTENKGSLVSGGELTVCLDGLAVDLGSLPNGSSVTDKSQHDEKDNANTIQSDDESQNLLPATNTPGARERTHSHLPESSRRGSAGNGDSAGNSKQSPSTRNRHGQTAKSLSNHSSSSAYVPILLRAQRYFVWSSHLGTPLHLALNSIAGKSKGKGLVDMETDPLGLDGEVAVNGTESGRGSPVCPPPPSPSVSLSTSLSASPPPSPASTEVGEPVRTATTEQPAAANQNLEALPTG